MFAELDKIALTTAIPLESISDVPSNSPIWKSPDGGGLIAGDVGIVVDVQGGGEWAARGVSGMERLHRGAGEHARVLGAPRHRARYCGSAVSGEDGGSGSGRLILADRPLSALGSSSRFSRAAVALAARAPAAARPCQTSVNGGFSPPAPIASAPRAIPSSASPSDRPRSPRRSRRRPSARSSTGLSRRGP